MFPQNGPIRVGMELRHLRSDTPRVRRRFWVFRPAQFLSLMLLTSLLSAVSVAVSERADAAYATPAHVQSVAAGNTGNGTTIAATFTTANLTIGNVIVAATTFDDAATTATCSDSAGQTYTNVGSPFAFTSSAQRLAVCWAPVTSATKPTVTVTFNATACCRAVAIHEYSGLETVNPVDVTAQATGTSTTPSSGNATTTTPTTLIFGALDSGGSAVNESAGAGFTLRTQSSRDTSNANGWRTEDKVVTSAGANAAVFGLDSSKSWAVRMVAFKAQEISPTLEQSRYRWYENTNNISPTNPLAAQNTAASLASASTPVRLRAQIGASGSALSASSQAFELQYGTSVSGPWSDVGSVAGWWDTSWSNRRKITFDNSASAVNLTNFPVLVSLSSSNIDYSKTQDSGQDIRFVDADGTTVLNYEIERWDESGTSTVWVKVPQIDSGSTTDYINMYYGNAVASDAQAVTSTWDSSNVGIWHLKESGNGTAAEYKDSASSANNGQGGSGTASKAPTRVTGKIGYAADFDGADDSINVGSAASLDDLSVYTMEAWINFDTFGEGNYGRILNKTSSSGSSNYWTLLNDGTDVATIQGWRQQATTNMSYKAVNNSLTTSTWKHVAFVKNGNTSIALYIDGALASYKDTTMGSGSLVTDAAQNMLIGNRPDETRTFDGRIDEVRISNAVRSADWIEANYLTQNNAFNTFGSEEAATPVWGYYNNATPADGATVTSTVLTSSNVNGSYVESATTPVNPNAVAAGSYGEWDFSLVPGTAAANTTYYFRIAKSDGSALNTYTVYPAIMISPQLNQEAYRFFSNASSTDVGSQLAAQDTAATAPLQGTPFRLRQTIHVTGTQYSIGTPSLKLQYATRSGTCDTAFSGETYSDVATGSGAIRFYNGTPADGATVTGNAADPTSGHTKVLQTYEEQNNATTIANIPTGQDGLWDFSLVDNSAPASTAYCFRLVKSDDSLLETYTTIPEITSNSGNIAPNAPTNLAQTKTDTTPIPATTHFNFDAGTQSWTQSVTQSVATKRTGAGSLQLSIGAGSTNGYTEDGQTRDLSAYGPMISAWVYVPGGTTGSLSTNLYVKTTAGTVNGPTASITTGEWTLVSMTVPPASLPIVTSIGIWTSGYGSAGTKYFYVDDVQQGSGIWTTESSVRFTATTSDPDGGDTTQLCIEAQPIATPFTNTEQSCGSLGAQGTSIHTLSSLTNGTQYHWQARVKDNSGTASAWVAYGGNKDSATASPDFGIDSSAPTAGTVKDGPSQGTDVNYNTGALDTLSANWTGFSDSSSGLARYEYSIGTAAGDTTTSGGWTSLRNNVTEVTRSGLNLRTGVVYYVNVRAVDVAGTTVGYVSSNGQMVAPTLTFTTDTNLIDFAKPTLGNSYAPPTKSVNIGVQTNAYGGYVVRQYASGQLTDGAKTVPFYGGTYASPTSWTGTGFGYTTSDTSIQAAGNPFNGATRYAGLTTTPPGDIVADRTTNITGTGVNDPFVLTYKLVTASNQKSGNYTTAVRLGVTANY